MGKDLLYLISSSGNAKGAQWLQYVLGEDYKVHVTRDIYRSSHIDSTVMCLKAGLVLLNELVFLNRIVLTFSTSGKRYSFQM